MKTTLLCITVSVFFYSCSPDPEIEAAENSSGVFERGAAEAQYPANAANPFDAKGQEIYKALCLYYQNNRTPNSVSELAAQIGQAAGRLFGQRNLTAKLIPFTDEMVESIMEDPDSSMILIVQNSVLQVYAKNNLISFLQNLTLKRQDEFSVTYSYITDYEAEVLNDAVFSLEETETILTVASIARYSLYSAEERKDRDWETNVGGKPARPFFEANQAALISLIALMDGLI